MSATPSSSARAVATCTCWRSMLAGRHAQVRGHSLESVGEYNGMFMVARCSGVLLAQDGAC